MMDMVDTVVDTIKKNPHVNVAKYLKKTTLKGARSCVHKLNRVMLTSLQDIAADGLMPNPDRWAPVHDEEPVFHLLQVFVQLKCSCCRILKLASSRYLLREFIVFPFTARSSRNLA